jgi:copper homeostasis protein
MLRDAEMLLELGADGVACGALSDGQSFDRQFWASLVQLTGPRQTVFHRAIDTVASPKKLLAELIELGTTHVLTSGGRATAVEGAEQIAKLREFADNQIEILPAAGNDPGTGVVADTYPATSQDRVAAARRAMDDLQL